MSQKSGNGIYSPLMQASRAGGAECYLGVEEPVLGAGKPVSGAVEAGFGSLGSRFSRVYKTLDILPFMTNFPLKSPQIRQNLGRVKRENFMSVTPWLKVISSSAVSSHSFCENFIFANIREYDRS